MTEGLSSFEGIPAPKRGGSELPNEEMAEFNAGAKIEADEAKELLAEYVPHFRQIAEHWNAEYVPDMRAFMKALPRKDYLVRRENPDRILESLEKGADLPIHFHGNEVRYNNAALWRPPSSSGLDNAYLEGNAHKYGLVTVLGVAKENLTDLDIHTLLPDSIESFGSVASREQVVSVDGTIAPAAFSFVLMRMPLNRVPDSLLTEDEMDDRDEWEERRMKGERPNPQFIYRGLVFGQKKAPPSQETH